MMRNSRHSWMTIRLNTGKTSVLSFLCFLLILIYSSALKDSAALSNTYIEAALTYIFVPIILGTAVIYSVGNTRLSYNKIVITIVILSYFALNIFYIYTNPGYSRILTTIICLIFLYQNESIQAQAFRMMKTALAISCVLGIAVGFLLSIGIEGAIKIDPIDNKRTFMSYFIVYFCKGRGFWRYCGFYNEPGALGTFCALFLCADSLDFKKKENIALLIGGAMSFSLAFVVIIGLFAVMKSATDWKRWIIIILIAAFYFFILPNIHTGNVGLDTLLHRVTFDGEGLSGDNRTNSEVEYLFNETLHSKYIFFGRKLGFANLTSGFSKNLVGPSYKTYIVDLGIVGTMLLLAPLCIAEMRRAGRNRDGIIYIIVSFINFYQRAMLLHRFIYFAVLISGLSNILQKSDNHRKPEMLTQ